MPIDYRSPDFITWQISIRVSSIQSQARAQAVDGPAIELTDILWGLATRVAALQRNGALSRRAAQSLLREIHAAVEATRPPSD